MLSNIITKILKDATSPGRRPGSAQSLCGADQAGRAGWLLVRLGLRRRRRIVVPTSQQDENPPLGRGGQAHENPLLPMKEKKKKDLGSLYMMKMKGRPPASSIRWRRGLEYCTAMQCFWINEQEGAVSKTSGIPWLLNFRYDGAPWSCIA